MVDGMWDRMRTQLPSSDAHDVFPFSVFRIPLLSLPALGIIIITSPLRHGPVILAGVLQLVLGAPRECHRLPFRAIDSEQRKKEQDVSYNTHVKTKVKTKAIEGEFVAKQRKRESIPRPGYPLAGLVCHRTETAPSSETCPGARRRPS